MMLCFQLFIWLFRSIIPFAVLINGDMESDVTVSMDKGNFQPIRIKTVVLEETVQATKDSQNPQITDYTIAAAKKAFEDAITQIQRQVKVERLKYPLLVPRICLNHSKSVLFKDAEGTPRIGCEQGCSEKTYCSRDEWTKTPESNFTAKNTLYEIQAAHLDACYDVDGNPVSIDKFPKGSGIPDADLFLYFAMDDKTYWKEPGKPAEDAGILAVATACHQLPMARNRPIMGFIKAYVGEHHLLKTGKTPGYHELVYVFMHEITHILTGSHRYGLYWKKGEGDGLVPWSDRSDKFPYLPLEKQDPNGGRPEHLFHEGHFSYFLPNSQLIEKVIGSPHDRTFLFRGPKTAQLAQTLFNCDTLEGIPMYLDDHLHHNLLYPEFMGPYAGASYFPGFLSTLTAAFLEDTGWYEVKRDGLYDPKPAMRLVGCNITNYLKDDCNTKEQRPFPFCQSRKMSFRCYHGIPHGKSTCDRNIYAPDKCYMESLQPQRPDYSDLTSYLAPMCQYKDLTPQYNVFWEKLDPETGTCFECDSNAARCSADWDALPPDVKANMSANVRTYLDEQKNPMHAACFSVDCSEIQGSPDSYMVTAAKGTPQKCTAGDNIRFEHGDITVGPFLCPAKSIVCGAQRLMMDFEKPSV